MKKVTKRDSTKKHAITSKSLEIPLVETARTSTTEPTSAIYTDMVIKGGLNCNNGTQNHRSISERHAIRSLSNVFQNAASVTVRQKRNKTRSLFSDCISHFTKPPGEHGSVERVRAY